MVSCFADVTVIMYVRVFPQLFLDSTLTWKYVTYRIQEIKMRTFDPKRRWTDISNDLVEATLPVNQFRKGHKVISKWKMLKKSISDSKGLKLGHLQNSEPKRQLICNESVRRLQGPSQSADCNLNEMMCWDVRRPGGQ